MKKKDIILIGAVLVVALVSIYVIKIMGRTQERLDVVVYVGNTEYIRIPLTEDTEDNFTVETLQGYNRIEIKDGTVSIYDADCPDQICVHTIPIDEPNDAPIVCLPHEVIVKIESAGDTNGQ
ncbi:MAG: NusG domain II-containing protein [Eubacteriales bacterium]